MRFVEAYAGETFIDEIPFAAEPPFEERDLAELRSIACDISRSCGDVADVEREPNFNYRLRLLFSCYRLTLEQAAMFAGVDALMMHRWRSSPRSTRYLAIKEFEFVRFEEGLINWIATRTDRVRIVRHPVR
jgi:hypothetical protein